MDPPPPNVDPPLPTSNVIMRVVTGKNLLDTFQRIKLLSDLKETPVLPSRLIETSMTTMTLFYEKSINHALALATTLIFKKAIEAEIKSGTYELGLIGLLDHNISYQAISKKECAIYFNTIVDESFIECTLHLLLTALRESHIAQEYGFEPPKRYQYQLFMMPYILGFLREEIEDGLFRYEPKHLKILQNKSVINSGINCVGTHGNVILKTVVGGEPLTSVDVSTNRGVFKLYLEQKDFYSPYGAKDNAQPASTEQFNLHKTRLCKHHGAGKRCFSGSTCSYAHGSHELRPKVGGSKSGVTHGSVPVSNVPPTNKQPGSDTTDGTDPVSMSADEGQFKDCAIIDHRKQSAVRVPNVDNPILGLSVPGALGESVNSSSSVDIAPKVAIKTVESLNGGKVPVPETGFTPDTLATADGIHNSATNSAVNGVDGSSLPPGNDMDLVNAMDVGELTEKNASTTSVCGINASTDSIVATPGVVILSKSQKKRAGKRAATSPPDPAMHNIKASANCIETDVLPGASDYDAAFPISPLSTVLSKKGALNGKGNNNTTPTTTGPALSLDGKAVPTTSSTGTFDFMIAKPPLTTPVRPKASEWTPVGKTSLPITHFSPGIKGPNVAGGGVSTAATSSNIGVGRSSSKGSGSPSTTRTMKGNNTSPSKQPKPAGVNFNRQTGNRYQALGDLANGCDGLSAQ